MSVQSPQPEPSGGSKTPSTPWHEGQGDTLPGETHPQGNLNQNHPSSSVVHWSGGRSGKRMSANSSNLSADRRATSPIKRQPSKLGLKSGFVAWAPMPLMVTLPIDCPSGLEYLIDVDELIVTRRVEFLEAMGKRQAKNKFLIQDNSLHLLFLAQINAESGCLPCCNRPNANIFLFDRNFEEVAHFSRSIKCFNSVTSPDGKIVVGLISNERAGLFKGFPSKAKVRRVTFPASLDVKSKVLLLAAIFLS